MTTPNQKNLFLGSKVLHVASILTGFVGIVTFAAVLFNGSDNLVFGVSTIHALLCTGILFLIAIWTQMATIHHMMLEKKGEII